MYSIHPPFHGTLLSQDPFVNLTQLILLHTYVMCNVNTIDRECMHRDSQLTAQDVANYNSNYITLDAGGLSNIEPRLECLE